MLKKTLYWITAWLYIVFRVILTFLLRNGIEILVTCFIYFNFYPGPRNLISFLIFFLIFEFAGFCGQKFGKMGHPQSEAQGPEKEDTDSEGATLSSLLEAILTTAKGECDCDNCRRRRGEIA